MYRAPHRNFHCTSRVVVVPRSAGYRIAMHEPALLITIAGAFAAAFLFGFGASKIGLPPLVGYLIAGVLLGPHSPAAFGDVALAGELAEVGVILLMFGVGLHFSPSDLLRVKSIALPGALLQMLLSIALGAGLALSWHWTPAAAIVFGLALSVCSTVVLLRVLESRDLLDSVDGRVAVGWSVVADLAVVIALVLLPAVLKAVGGPATASGAAAATAPSAGALIWSIALTLLKVAAFIALMGVVGRRAVPWLLIHVARSGSRELFTLSVLAVALGVAVGASSVFGVSFALGAFVAGVVISESELSYRAGANALPMQDAFAVLFFVSVGMLIDPTVLLRDPLKVLQTVAVIVLGNSVISTVLMVMFRHPLGASMRLGASFGQIGEFSFILAGMGVAMGVLNNDVRSMILAASLVTITLNPVLFFAADRLANTLAHYPRLLALLEREQAPRSVMTDVFMGTPTNHAIVIGYGRVGRTISDALTRQRKPFVVIEQDRRVVDAMRTLNVPTIYGDATRHGILDYAKPEFAKLLIIASPDPYRSQHIVELVRKHNPEIEIIVRTNGDVEQEWFERLMVSKALMAERELALGMAYHSMRTLGATVAQADNIIHMMRTGARLSTVEFNSLTIPQEPAAAE